MKLGVFAFLSILFALSASAQTPQINYRFERVRSKVIVASADHELRAQQGTEARGGDRVRTGWFGYAIVGARRYAATFEIYSSSDVLLSPSTPGVILSLERGRIKAMFEKMSGEEPRTVKTPGALLAVRGTRYGVEVGRDGNARLAVFEGAVEVISPLRVQPLIVHAGEVCEFGLTHAPMAMPMPGGMSEHMWDQHGAGDAMHDGGNPMSGDPMGGRSMGGHGSSSGRHH